MKRVATLPESPDVSFSVGVREGRGAEALMARGTVKWFSEEKGYGFICPEGGEEEIFVHYTDVEGWGFRSLGEGERVSYELAKSARGARRGEEAKNVRRVR